MALGVSDRRRIAGQIARRATEENTVESLSERVRGSVVGQDEAVRDVCRFLLAGLARVERLCSGVPESGLPHLDAILVDGPSGCGKTLIVQRACEALGAATYTIDGSSLTGAGWRGGDLERHELRLAEAQGRASTCRPTIVFVDEADKLARDETNARGFSPCQNLLRLIEGSEAMTVDSPGSDGTSLTLDKSLLVFVLAGAFDGIDEIVRRRLRTESPSVGFGTAGADAPDPDGLRALASVDDYMAWGLPRELVGRITTATRVRQLGAGDLERIARGTCGSVESRFAAMMPAGCTLSISPGAARIAAGEAARSGRGARGLEASLGAACMEAIERARTDPGVASATVTELDGGLSVECARGERKAAETGAEDAEAAPGDRGDEAAGAGREEPPSDGRPRVGGRHGGATKWAPPMRVGAEADLEHVAVELRSRAGTDAPDPVATVSSSHGARAMADAIADVLLPDMDPRRARLANLLLRGCLSYLRHWCAPERMGLASLLAVVRGASTDEGRERIVAFLFDGHGGEEGHEPGARWGRADLGASRRTGAVTHFGISPEDDSALGMLGCFWGIAGDDAAPIAAEVANALERIA